MSKTSDINTVAEWLHYAAIGGPVTRRQLAQKAKLVAQSATNPDWSFNPAHSWVRVAAEILRAFPQAHAYFADSREVRLVRVFPRNEDSPIGEFVVAGGTPNQWFDFAAREYGDIEIADYSL